MDAEQAFGALTAELEQARLHLEKAQAYVRNLITLSSSQQDPSQRITIHLSQGNINNSYLHLADSLDFFPTDAIGAPNAEHGQGALLTLHFEGLPEPVRTDIPSDHKIFRCRSEVGRFFTLHGLVNGDSVVIERLSAYEYRIAPLR